MWSFLEIKAGSKNSVSNSLSFMLSLDINVDNHSNITCMRCKVISVKDKSRALWSTYPARLLLHPAQRDACVNLSTTIAIVGTINRRGRLGMVANKKALFVTRVHRFEAHRSQFFSDSLGLQVTQMPTSPDLVIFVRTKIDKTDYITPCACAWGN